METKFWVFKISLLLVLALAMALSAAAADLPADAAVAVTAYDKAVAEVQAKADTQKAELAKRLLPLLDAAMKKATQKGDLESAMAVKEKIDDISPLVNASLFVTKPQAVEYLLGAWKVTHNGQRPLTVTFQKGGAVKASNNATGRWEVDKQAKECKITWMNGVEYTVTLAGGDFSKGTFAGATNQGETLAWAR